MLLNVFIHYITSSAFQQYLKAETRISIAQNTSHFIESRVSGMSKMATVWGVIRVVAGWFALQTVSLSLCNFKVGFTPKRWAIQGHDQPGTRHCFNLEIWLKKGCDVDNLISTLLWCRFTNVGSTSANKRRINVYLWLIVWRFNVESTSFCPLRAY
jgi:hypothetical protein